MFFSSVGRLRNELPGTNPSPPPTPVGLWCISTKENFTIVLLSVPAFHHNGPQAVSHTPHNTLFNVFSELTYGVLHMMDELYDFWLFLFSASLFTFIGQNLKLS